MSNYDWTRFERHTFIEADPATVFLAWGSARKLGAAIRHDAPACS